VAEEKSKWSKRLLGAAGQDNGARALVAMLVTGCVSVLVVVLVILLVWHLRGSP